MKLDLEIWRQLGPRDGGRFVSYEMDEAVPDMSFLELLDVLNERLERAGEEPVAFEHNCREGICGSCGFLINGRAHGPLRGVTVCQLHLRHFEDGAHIVLEPWRARAFPVIKDLVVDRCAFDRVVQAGGFISVNTGSAPEANSLPVPRAAADRAMDAAACIGCGACVASCKNAAAMLFAGAKVTQLALLPQGAPRAPPPRRRHGGGDGRRGLRQLHQRARVRARLPQGDLVRQHRPPQPRVPRFQALPLTGMTEDARSLLPEVSRRFSLNTAPGTRLRRNPTNREMLPFRDSRTQEHP